MLDFVADSTKIGLETQQHLLHPRENSITSLNLRDRKTATEEQYIHAEIVGSCETHVVMAPLTRPIPTSASGEASNGGRTTERMSDVVKHTAC